MPLHFLYFYKLISLVIHIPVLGTSPPPILNAFYGCVAQTRAPQFQIIMHKTKVFCSTIQGAPFLCYSRPKCLLLPAGTPAESTLQVQPLIIIHLSLWKRPDQPDPTWHWIQEQHWPTGRLTTTQLWVALRAELPCQRYFTVGSTLPDEEERNSEVLSIQLNKHTLEHQL